jgi:hypothetical protein
MMLATQDILANRLLDKTGEASPSSKTLSAASRSSGSTRTDGKVAVFMIHAPCIAIAIHGARVFGMNASESNQWLQRTRRLPCPEYAAVAKKRHAG